MLNSLNYILGVIVYSMSVVVEEPSIDTDTAEPIEVIELRSRLSPEVNVALNTQDCLRFLVARNYDIEETVTRLENWYEWYHKPFGEEGSGLTPARMLNLDNIVDPNIDLINELVPHSYSGFCKNGCPIFWEKTGIIAGNLPELKKYFNMDILMEQHIRVQTIMNIRRHYISKKLSRNVEQAMIVCDYTDLSISPDWFGIEYCKQLFTIDEKYYPERLYKTYLINAPWYFTALYRLVSPWIDPKTATKIVVLGSDYLDTIREDIDDSEIPVEYGGTNEDFRWSWPFHESSGAAPHQIKEYLLQENIKKDLS